jgi:hypothetical protein
MNMHWEGCGRKWSWPNLRYCLSICMKGLGKTTETFGQTNWFSVLAFETGTSEISCGSANHSAMVFSKMVKVTFFVIHIHSGSITDFINKIPYFFFWRQTL